MGRCERLGEGKLAGGVETEELVLGGQDEVVVEWDAEEMERRDDLLGDVVIVGGGGRVSCRVIMQKNHPGGADQEGSAGDFGGLGVGAQDGAR